MQINDHVSIIIPVVRPARSKDCISSVLENTGIPPTRFEIVSELDYDRIGAPKMVKKLVEKSKYDYVCFLGDDTIAEPDFLKNALEVMHQFPDSWGLVALNDGIHTGNLATHWLAHKKLLDFLNGTFFNISYVHCFCDNELTERCKEMGRYAYAENAKIIHNHPVRDIRFNDRFYRSVYDESVFIKDMLLYQKRKRNNWK
jgi:GT2 family glycosyltransferase